MSDNLFFIVELALDPNQVDDVRAVMRDMAELTKAEAGTLNYEWFVSDDGTACHIYERYADADAALVHSASFPEELMRRSQAFRPTRLTGYGAMTDEVVAKRIQPLVDAVPDVTVRLLEPLGGFAR